MMNNIRDQFTELGEFYDRLHEIMRTAKLADGCATVSTNAMLSVISEMNRRQCDRTAESLRRENTAMRVTLWYRTHRTGVSSEYLAACGVGDTHWQQRVECGAGGSQPWPHDGGDFERCCDLLTSVPEIREKAFGVASAKYPQWRAIIAHWDELVLLMCHDIAIEDEPERAYKEWAGLTKAQRRGKVRPSPHVDTHLLKFNARLREILSKCGAN